jgi:hypothetical protein
MKLPFGISSLYLLIASCSLFSCKSIHLFEGDTYAARDKDKQSFVQTKDGQVIQANEAVLHAPLIGRSTIKLDGDTSIPVKNVVAYQNREAYYMKIGGQFAPRIKKGLINMYRTTYLETTYTPASTSNGMQSGFSTHEREIFYLQKGDSSEVRKFTLKLVGQYVQDYAPAMEYMNKFKRTRNQVRLWSVVNISAMFGGLYLAALATNNSNKFTAGGYASLGLCFGGVASGFVNRVRKIKNYKNVELAIDEYNYQEKRKRK